jgi:hypothetical protein
MRGHTPADAGCRSGDERDPAVKRRHSTLNYQDGQPD